MYNYPKIVVVPYDSNWPKLYMQEARKIKAALGDLLARVHHIGSTSMPNMPAKPVIDILIECNDIYAIETIKNKLHSLGYDQYMRQIIPHRSFFTRRYQDHSGYHLHFYEKGDPQIARHINFRDYLIAHPEVAKNYADLKLSLATQYSDERMKYLLGKSKLVLEIDSNAKVWSGRRKDLLLPNKGQALEHRSQENLTKSIVANFNIYLTHFPQYLMRVEFTRMPGNTWVSSGIADDRFNFILDADFTEADANNKITEITAIFEKTKLPFSWWVSRYDKPKELTTILEKNAYKNTQNYHAMYFNLDLLGDSKNLTPQLKIIQARDEKTLHDFAILSAKGGVDLKSYFSDVAALITADDPIEFYVGYLENAPVVCASSCYYAGVVGLYSFSTSEPSIQKSYGAAMREYQLKRAKEEGYPIAVVLVTDKHITEYLSLGYLQDGEFKKYNVR